MFDTNPKIPQIIILYGPPNAGKGTQADFLKKKFPDRFHLDFGAQLRAFVTKHIGDLKLLEPKVNPDSPEIDIETAKRLKACLITSNPVDSDDLKYVVESAVIECVQNGQGMIVEGPGRLVEEAQWLSSFLSSKNISVCIFHLHVSIEEVLHRASSRYYVQGIDKAFNSLESATNSYTNEQKPYRRVEDDDIEGTKKRYSVMYSENFALITSIYQLGCKAQLFTLDGRKSIDNVSADINRYLQVFFG